MDCALLVKQRRCIADKLRFETGIKLTAAGLKPVCSFCPKHAAAHAGDLIWEADCLDICLAFQAWAAIRRAPLMCCARSVRHPVLAAGGLLLSLCLCLFVRPVIAILMLHILEGEPEAGDLQQVSSTAIHHHSLQHQQ